MTLGLNLATKRQKIVSVDSFYTKRAERKKKSDSCGAKYRDQNFSNYLLAHALSRTLCIQLLLPRNSYDFYGRL